MSKQNKQPRRYQTGLITLVTLVGLSIGLLMVHADTSPKNPVKVPTTGTKVTVDDTQLQKAVSDAQAVGVVVNQTKTDQNAIPYSDLSGAKALISQHYQTQADKLTETTKQQQQHNDDYAAKKKVYDAAKAKYDKDKAQYDKDKAKYDQDLNNFNHGTSVETTMQALTQDSNNSTYHSFMHATVDQKTGNFTLTHDMNDGVSIIGHGYLTGKINWSVTSRGDGSETIKIDSISLYNYHYNNENVNTALNKNISFHVYDNAGHEIYVVHHDGGHTFSNDINKTVSLNVTKTVQPGAETDLTKLLSADDDWIYSTHGQIYAKFKNTNHRPTAPTPPTPPVAPTKSTPLTGEYQMTNLLVLPKPTKDVALGTVAGVNTQSINGKKVVKGQALTYVLRSTDLPANRLDVVTLFQYTDPLPKAVDYQSAKLFSADGKTDLTSQFDINYDDQTRRVTFTAKSDYLTQMNDDKTKEFVKPIADIYAVANQDQASFDNKYTETVNDDQNTSNLVHNTTPDVKPIKQDLDDDDHNIDGKSVMAGTTMNYHLTWDLSGLDHLAISDEMLAKGLSFSDDYDESKLNVIAKTKTDFTIIDTKTKNSVASQVTVTWDEKKGNWTVKANKPKAFLKAHGGHQIVITFKPVVKDDATGVLTNTGQQDDFGQVYQTNTVKNNLTPKPKPKPTPNTSYGEKPKGLWYAIIAFSGMLLIGIVCYKPLKHWLTK